MNQIQKIEASEETGMGIDLTIFADGHWTAVETSKKAYDLDTMQKRVDGNIEVVSNGEINLIIDEEGLLKRRPLNYLASALLKTYGILPNSALVGDVMIAATKDGEIVPLTKEQYAEIEAWLKDWQPEALAWMKFQEERVQQRHVIGDQGE